MKKALLLLLAIGMTIILSGCQNAGKNEFGLNEGGHLDIIPSVEKYDYDILRINQIKQPKGIIVTNENILISDAEKHCIHVLDLDMNYISSFGRLGMENGSFFRPAEMAWQNGQLYVVDSKNCRIQVFDDKYSFLKAYTLTKIDYDDPYKSIAVTSDGDIYITSTSALPQYAHIYHIHPQDGRQSLIGNNIMGSVCLADNKVLFLESYEISNNFGNISYTTGLNRLFGINEDKMNQIAELPYMYCPKNLVYHDGAFYSVSLRYSTLDKFDMEGNYIETLFHLPDGFESTSSYGLAYNENDKSFLLTFTENGRILRVHAVNN